MLPHVPVGRTPSFALAPRSGTTRARYNLTVLRTVAATRYVTPLREGGSLPAIVEADDCGLYVLKFRGAGQGPLALVAELIAGEIGRALGLMIPEIVLMEVDPVLGRNEPDQEIRELILASAGLNLALDYLPGSVMFDPAARIPVDPIIASKAVWFDAFITNVDRTARNPNLLWWHKTLYFIDHGASLYFHHDWQDLERKAERPFPAIRNHVLFPQATRIDEVAGGLKSLLTRNVLADILAGVPDGWLDDPEEKRQGYLSYFMRRLNAAPKFFQDA
jgi:hypothetical protein